MEGHTGRHRFSMGGTCPSPRPPPMTTPLKGPLWEKNGHFVFKGPYRHRAPRVKGPKKVVPIKGPMQTRGPDDQGAHTYKGPIQTKDPL